MKDEHGLCLTCQPMIFPHVKEKNAIKKTRGFKKEYISKKIKVWKF